MADAHDLPGKVILAAGEHQPRARISRLSAAHSMPSGTRAAVTVCEAWAGIGEEVQAQAAQPSARSGGTGGVAGEDLLVAFLFEHLERHSRARRARRRPASTVSHRCASDLRALARSK